MTRREKLIQMATEARQASRALEKLSGKERADILLEFARELEAKEQQIFQANNEDISRAREAQLSGALVDRLTLDEKRVRSITAGLRQVAALPDPLRQVLSDTRRPNGLHIQKIRVPIGVIVMIFEARPNVAVDSAGLCIKTGNAVILRGGKEALSTNRALIEILQTVGVQAGLPKGALQLVTDPDRAIVEDLVQLEGYVDLAMPRGGESLIRAVTAAARVPVIKHYKGVCHVYVHSKANIELALRIIENAKCERPGVCNALETVLVDKSIAQEFLPRMAAVLEKRSVEIRGDQEAQAIVRSFQAATDEDWSTEYLDLILSVRVVSGIDEAIAHINTYGSQHSDAVVTTELEAQERFLAEVDSAAVYVNASTRFTDGGEFGMGAEIGISTDKLHARGPMGLEELCSYKYIIRGDGQIRP